MQLRKDLFFKSFFIAFFFLWFLIPAVAPNFLHYQSNTYEINRPNHRPILINLFSELLNKNEESKADCKSITQIKDTFQTVTGSPEYLNLGKPSDIHKTCHPYSSYSSLFTIYCEYRI